MARVVSASVFRGTSAANPARRTARRSARRSQPRPVRRRQPAGRRRAHPRLGQASTSHRAGKSNLHHKQPRTGSARGAAGGAVGWRTRTGCATPLGSQRLTPCVAHVGNAARRYEAVTVALDTQWADCRRHRCRCAAWPCLSSRPSKEIRHAVSDRGNPVRRRSRGRPSVAPPRGQHPVREERRS